MSPFRLAVASALAPRHLGPNEGEVQGTDHERKRCEVPHHLSTFWPCLFLVPFAVLLVALFGLYLSPEKSVVKRPVNLYAR